MTLLSPAVIENGEVLRRFADARPIESMAALAREFGRDKANFHRTLKALETAEVLAAPSDGATVPSLTPRGRQALQALDLAEGRIAVPEGFVALRHAQILPDALNPRTDFDSPEHHESLTELMSDILQNGLLQNLLVRPAEPSDDFRVLDGAGHPLAQFRLISGERRWRAIGNLIHDGDWPEDRPLPCQVIQTDDLGHRLRALAENLQRRNLSPIEEAKAFKHLTGLGLTTQDLADKVSVTQRQVQMRLQLLELAPKDQERMELPKEDPKHLTVTEARRILQHSKPTGPELAPEELLMLAEVAHKVLREPGEGHQRTECGAEAEEAKGTLGTYPLYLLSVDALSFRDARSYVSLGYRGREAVDALAPDFAGDPDAALHRIRIEVRGEAATTALKPGEYFSPWLNGPWEPDRERLAEIEARTAEELRRREEDQKRSARVLSAVQDAKSLADDLEKIEARDPIDPRLAYSLSQIAGTLPWSVNEHGFIVDCAGREISCIRGWTGEHNRDLEARRLVVAAVNAAAGLTTPASAPADPATKPLTREEFEGAIAACIGDDGETPPEQAAKHAKELLAAYLADNGLEYGAEDASWTEAEAAELVEAAAQATTLSTQLARSGWPIYSVLQLQ